MALAIFLIPLWFARGRLLIGGHYDFKGEFLIDILGMTGVVVFQLLIWRWERRKRAETKQLNPPMAWCLLLCYLLHITFQVFFVDDDSNNEGGWSVASKYLGVEQELSRTLGGIIAVTIWVDMIFMVVMSYFTPAQPHQKPDGTTWTGMEFFRERMYNTLRPATLLGAIWYAAGHAVLGNCFGWGGELLLMYAIPVFIPFHILLWRRERRGTAPNYENQMVDPYMAIALASYYVIHFVLQIFTEDGYRSGGSTATLYLLLDQSTSMKVGKLLLRALYMNMAVIGGLTFFRCQEDAIDEPNQEENKEGKNELKVALLGAEGTDMTQHTISKEEDSA